MDQFDNIKCPTCGREYSGLLTSCPYCELGLDATNPLPRISVEEPVAEAAPAPAQGEDSLIFWPDPVELPQAEAAQPAAVAAPKAAPNVQRVNVARPATRQAPHQEEPEEKRASGILTGLVCIILAIAILVGAFLALRSMGIFGSSSDADATTPTLPVETTPSEEDAEESDILEDDSTEAEPVDSATLDAEPEEETLEEDATILLEDDGSTDSIAVECTSISLNLSDISLFSIGETYTFTVSVSPASAADYVTWSSSDIAVCSVSDNGTVTAVNGGNAEIIVTCGDKSASCIIRCAFATVDLEDLFTLNLTDITLFYPGETAQLQVSNMDESSSELTWASEDPSIATVTDGLVTAVGNGTTTITATLMSGSVEGQTMSCIVRCNLSSSTDSGETTTTGSYSLSTNDATMTREGEYFQLTISSDASDTIPSHTWTSGDTDVCYVDEFGVVYAVGSGTTTVSTTVDGQYLACIVRVNLS